MHRIPYNTTQLRTAKMVELKYRRRSFEVLVGTPFDHNKGITRKQRLLPGKRVFLQILPRVTHKSAIQKSRRRDVGFSVEIR